MPSRIENILQAIIDGSDPSQLPPPQSRNEELLLQVLEVIESGGGIDYDTIVSDVIRKTTPDYANASDPVDVKSGNDFTYTATERCIMSMAFAGTRSYRMIKVNNKAVASIAASAAYSSAPEVLPYCIPLSAGDVLYVTNPFNSSSSMTYYVIPYKS